MALISDIGTRIRRGGWRLPRLRLGIVAKRLLVRLRRAAKPLSGVGQGVMTRLPKGLYARSILIVVTPIVILQSVVAYVFMERHWQTVTQRLSSAVTRDIAAIIEVIETYPQDERFSEVARIARDAMGLTVSVLPPDPLPPPAPKPFFSLLDRALSHEISRQIGRPFWIDTVGNSDLVEIRIQLDEQVLRIFTNRSQAYASNSHIFLVWMVGTSLVLLAIALLFLRNQIKPILSLANAAERFGKGQPAEFRPRGAREVRKASQAFLDMRERIERQIEQRTAMLSGVSHDLRTILTRFRLELEMLGRQPEAEAMRADVDEMSRMLEDYLAFAKGDSGEASEAIDIPQLIDEVAESARRSGEAVATRFSGDPHVQVRPLALRRCLTNLIGNAATHAANVEVTARHTGGLLTIDIDDDGPGIPEEEREAVFRPFYRLDHGRNVDCGGTGLGLAIARDIARSHGGDIGLGESPLGGLRARLTIPA